MKLLLKLVMPRFQVGEAQPGILRFDFFFSVTQQNQFGQHPADDINGQGLNGRHQVTTGFTWPWHLLIQQLLNMGGQGRPVVPENIFEKKEDHYRTTENAEHKSQNCLPAVTMVLKYTQQQKVDAPENKTDQHYRGKTVEDPAIPGFIHRKGRYRSQNAEKRGGDQRQFYQLTIRYFFFHQLKVTGKGRFRRHVQTEPAHVTVNGNTQLCRLFNETKYC